MAALSQSPIHRLKRTWEQVPTRTMTSFMELQALMGVAKNWAEYRELLHSVNPPCVPFVGIYLTDLVMIEDGNPNNLKKSEQLINFYKRVKTAEVIREIQQYQSVPYCLTTVPEIQAFIRRGMDCTKSVAVLYDMSLALEPRERGDEKIARMLTESGMLPKTTTSSYPMRIQWEPPPVATSANFYDGLASLGPKQGDDSPTSNSPDTLNTPPGHTTDDTADMSSTTTTPQDTPQITSSSERSLGNLGPVLSFLGLEKRGLRTKRPNTINAEMASGSLGDFSQAFRYLKTQRHQVEAHRSPPEQDTSSSSLSLLSTLLGAHVMEESDKSVTFVINQDNQKSQEMPPKPEKERRKLKKKSSRRILAIDEPSSSSGGGCASSESDQKETLAEKKTSMENADVYFLEETKIQTDPKTTHVIDNKPRTRKQAPVPPKKWHWTLRGTMTKMERLFRAERLAQEKRQLEITTTTVKTRRPSELLDSGTENDDHRANSRPGNSAITRKPPSKIFWSKNSEHVQKTLVVQTKPMYALCTLTTSAKRTSEELLSPLSHLVAMRKRDMFLVPRGLERLTKVLPRSPSVTCSSSTDTSEEETSTTTTATETATTTATTSPAVSSTAQPEKHSPMPNTLTLGSTWPIADKNQPGAIKVPGPERVFVFVDNSNILTGFYHYYERMAPPQSPTLHHHRHHHPDKHDHGDDITKDTFLEVSPSSLPRDEHSTDSEEETVLYPRGIRSCTNDIKPTKATGPTTPSPDCPTTASTDTVPAKARPIMVKSRSFRPKFDYASFFSLLQRSRPTERRILVGSAPLFQELDVAMEYQYETKILRRVRKFVQGTGSGSGSTQGEQCVDELLHLKMLETILDHEPAVMVLATGDGGDSEFGGEGFYGVIKRALGRGWQVEIVSWEDQLSGVYIELAQEYKYPPEHEHTGVYRQPHPQHGRHPCHAPQPALGRKGSLRIICLDWVGQQFTQF
ncbi:hypothetical protein BG000_007831 [Podila horticola]|nr:hypothetical protein BG000_007831 [Podila horticola]